MRNASGLNIGLVDYFIYAKNYNPALPGCYYFDRGVDCVHHHIHTMRIMLCGKLRLLQPAMQNFSSVPTFETHRNIIEYNFETLKEIHGIPGPKFVLAHITLPHPPCVFGAEGESLTPDYRLVTMMEMILR